MPSKHLGSLLVAAFMWALPVATSIAQQGDAAAATAPDAEIATAAVRLDGRMLFKVRGSSSYPAEERAALISERIVTLARNSTVDPEAIVVTPAPLGLQIQGGELMLMTVVDSDAALELIRMDVLAERHRARIQQAVRQYRADRDPGKLALGLLYSLAATAVLAALAFVIGAVFRKLTALLERRVSAHIETLPRGAFQFVPGRQIWEAMTATVRGIRLIVMLILLFLWLQFVLSQFPWTRWVSDELLTLLVDPLVRMGTSFVDYLPSLLFLVVLAIVTRYGLRLLKLYFAALERSTTRLANFEPEWALPVYKIVRTVVIGLALVMAYPYIPGSGSQALQGLSVFAGLMLSLGASGAVSNVIAGYFNTFGRVLHVGDIIKVGDVVGEVTQVRLLTTRVRTIKNEEVTIPNATIITTHLTNYSALAKTSGLILHTEVGIGYETPWRQVHAMLEEAARRTPELRPEPKPFILQRKLGDFAVVYELNVYADRPQGMAQTYSNLHQNILDVFNEHGVQIMTPAYEGDPEQPKIVPREQWFTPPAKPAA